MLGAIAGAIAGDIVGSIDEGRTSRIEHTVFPLFQPASRFTDDTVLPVAVVNAIRTAGDCARPIRASARRQPRRTKYRTLTGWAPADPGPEDRERDGRAAFRLAPSDRAC